MALFSYTIIKLFDYVLHCFNCLVSLLLIHPRHREGQQSWKYNVERILLAAEH